MLGQTYFIAIHILMLYSTYTVVYCLVNSHNSHQLIGIFGNYKIKTIFILKPDHNKLFLKTTLSCMC